MLPSKRAAEIPWDEVALIVWQAPIPKADDVLAHQLQAHAAAGRSLLFLPPDSPDDTQIFGLNWTQWEAATGDKPQTVEWWRNDDDLLANTRDGAALPVGTLEVTRRCGISGDGIPLARCAGGDALLMRSSAEQTGGVYFLGTLPSPAASSLARDGVVMFALLQRALSDGARTLGNALQRSAPADALGCDRATWAPVEKNAATELSPNLPLRAGVVTDGVQLIALNRPRGEDAPGALSAAEVGELFAGLDFRLLTDSLEDGRNLTTEIWRTFLFAMALALLAEALLCMPPRRDLAAEPRKLASAGFSPPEPAVSNK